MYVYVGTYQWAYPAIICNLYFVKSKFGPRIFLPLKCGPAASKVSTPLILYLVQAWMQLFFCFPCKPPLHTITFAFKILFCSMKRLWEKYEVNHLCVQTEVKRVARMRGEAALFIKRQKVSEGYRLHVTFTLRSKIDKIIRHKKSPKDIDCV
jgi:hypothetical protein